MSKRDDLLVRRGEIDAEVKRLTRFDELTAAQRATLGELSTEMQTVSADLTDLDRADVAASLKAGRVGVESGDGHRPVDTAPAARDDAPELPAWATKGRRTDSWAAATATQIGKAVMASGRKSVVSGAYEVDSPIRPGILQLPAYPARVLDLLVSRQPLNTGNVFNWLQQSVRTNNAASVPDNATKPTSVYTFLEKEDRCRVIAHISENIPIRYLSDFTGLQDFLHAEMLYGLSREVERQVLAGEGTPGAAGQAAAEDEDMLGLLNTTGVGVQAFVNDPLTSLRKAATKLEVEGQTPNAWLCHPADIESLDLLQTADGQYIFAGPPKQIAEQDPVWSIPVVKSTAVTQGTAVLGDWSQITLVVREDAQLTIDASGDRWEKNQFAMRLEGRYGVYVTRPSAFCTVSLTA